MPRGRSRHASSSRGFPRTARINESMREVIASELELIDDDRLLMVTITGIEVDPDLSRARVFYSALMGQSEAGLGFAQHRARLQASVGRQIRMKRTPLLSFTADPYVELEEVTDREYCAAGSPPPVATPSERLFERKFKSFPFQQSQR